MEKLPIHQICIEKDKTIDIQDIVPALLPVKTGAEKLSSRNATVLSSEAVSQFILNELKEQNNWLALQMCEILKKRVMERRHSNLVGLTKYLHFGREYMSQATSHSFPTGGMIVRHCCRL